MLTQLVPWAAARRRAAGPFPATSAEADRDPFGHGRGGGQDGGAVEGGSAGDQVVGGPDRVQPELFGKPCAGADIAQDRAG
jgi:hypothetical protein